MNHSVSMLAVVTVGPLALLLVLSALAALLFQRAHRGPTERLAARDAEYGIIDGLIASNVGESTLAVRRCCSCHPPPPNPRLRGRQLLPISTGFLCQEKDGNFVSWLAQSLVTEAVPSRVPSTLAVGKCTSEMTEKVSEGHFWYIRGTITWGTKLYQVCALFTNSVTPSVQ